MALQRLVEVRRVAFRVVQHCKEEAVDTWGLEAPSVEDRAALGHLGSLGVGVKRKGQEEAAYGMWRA